MATAPPAAGASWRASGPSRCDIPRSRPAAVDGRGGRRRWWLLIAWARLNAFVALTLISLFVGAVVGHAARIGRPRVPGGRRQHAGVHRGGHRARDHRRQDAGRIRRGGGRRRTADRRCSASRHVHWAWRSWPSSWACRCSSAWASCCSRRSCSRWRGVSGFRCCSLGLPLVAGLSASHGAGAAAPRSARRDRTSRRGHGPHDRVVARHRPAGRAHRRSAARVVVGRRIATAPGALAAELSAVADRPAPTRVRR